MTLPLRREGELVDIECFACSAATLQRCGTRMVCPTCGEALERDEELVDKLALVILQLNEPPPAGRALKTSHTQARWFAEAILEVAAGAAQERLAEMHHEVELAQRDRDGLERDLRGKRLRIANLERELAGMRKTDEHSDDAKAIFDYWNARLRDGRAKSFAGKREAAVLKALKTYTVNDLVKAIDGARIDAYVDPKTGKRYDELELICRDATYIDRFIDAEQRFNTRLQDYIERTI